MKKYEVHKSIMQRISYGKKVLTIMNYLWGLMIVIGVVFAAFQGTLPQVTEAAISSAKEAVTLCITMMGVMSFWVGIMRIAENSGIIEGATRKLMPFLHFLFPNIPKGIAVKGKAFHLSGQYAHFRPLLPLRRLRIKNIGA